MNIFNLPDLGEGLPDAEIHEWFVKEGDTVKADQPLVSMETAKAVVDVPCPHDGIILKLYGKPGDVIRTGSPLVEFKTANKPQEDKGTVVGSLEEGTGINEDAFIIGANRSASTHAKVTPSVKMLAKKLSVDLKTMKGSGEHGLITREDVEVAAKGNIQCPNGFEPLRGVRRAMLASMVQSHEEVVAVSIYDEADIECWGEDNDITVRLIRAMAHACHKEPALNAWFDSQFSARQCFSEVNLGLALDNEEGLFVPVIHHVDKHNDTELRQIINDYKKRAQERSLSTEQLKGATITLSNFGKFAGRFASPIIVPPMVAILAVGRLHDAVVVNQGKIEKHRLLPLSLSFDHRAVTGGEATRFLGALIDALQKP